MVRILTSTSTKEAWLHILLKKLFQFPENVQIKNISFKWQKVRTKGSVLRQCGTVYHPGSPPPYTDKNWYSKICAVVICGVKVLSFSALNKN